MTGCPQCGGRGKYFKAVEAKWLDCPCCAYAEQRYQEALDEVGRLLPGWSRGKLIQALRQRSQEKAGVRMGLSGNLIVRGQEGEG